MTCQIEGCNRPIVNKRGWCGRHYARWRRYGDPLGGGTEHGEPLTFLKSVLGQIGNDCIAWPYAKSDGYGVCENEYVHRIVCEHINGLQPTSKHEVAHNCGNAECCNPKHLRWATRSENHQDKRLHGTSGIGKSRPCVQGEKHARAKLKTEQVLEIRRLSNEGSTRVELALKYGVRPTLISGVVLRQIWKHV